jgi:hypothetical protein
VIPFKAALLVPQDLENLHQNFALRPLHWTCPGRQLADPPELSFELGPVRREDVVEDAVLQRLLACLFNGAVDRRQQTPNIVFLGNCVLKLSEWLIDVAGVDVQQEGTDVRIPRLRKSSRFEMDPGRVEVALGEANDADPRLL